MTMKYIVQLTDNSWIAPWEGDPGRTLRKRSAALFDTQQRAERALNKAREYRPFPEAQVISISIDTDHTRRPVCPHCNQERGCVEALALVRDGDEDTVECACGNAYVVTLHVEASYSTRKEEE